LLAGISAALVAIDGELVDAATAARAAVSDDEQIRLTLYAEDHAVAAIEPEPARAVGLAGRLIEAAAPKLRRGADDLLQHPCK
jgi:hypothetical protein